MTGSMSGRGHSDSESDLSETDDSQLSDSDSQVTPFHPILFCLLFFLEQHVYSTSWYALHKQFVVCTNSLLSRLPTIPALVPGTGQVSLGGSHGLSPRGGGSDSDSPRGGRRRNISDDDHTR